MRGAARKQSSRQEWQNSNEGEEGAGGTFAGREGLAVLDVELRTHACRHRPCPSSSSPTPSCSSISARSHPKKIHRVRVLGLRHCNRDLGGHGARNPYLGHDGAVFSGFRGPLVAGGLALGRRLAPAPAGIKRSPGVGCAGYMDGADCLSAWELVVRDS